MGRIFSSTTMGWIYKLPLFYVNQVGAQTDIIFDGGSLVFDEEGHIVGILSISLKDFKPLNIKGDLQPGDIIEKEGKPYRKFYGMSSSTAMDKHVGGVAEYRASEGKTVEVPYKGDVEATLQDILGGLRSTCTYVGAQRLKELTKRTTFIRVNEQENRVYSEWFCLK